MRFAWLAVVVVAVLVLPLFAVMDSARDLVLPQIVVLVTLGIAIMAIGALWGREPGLPLIADPFALMLLFLAQFYVIGPFASRAIEIYSVPFVYRHAPERAVEAILAFVLFVVFAIVGHKLELGRMLGRMLPDFRSSRPRPSGRVVQWILIGGGVLGCLGWIWFNGGLVAKMSTGYGQWRAGGAMFRIAWVAVQAGTLLMSWRLFSQDRPRRIERWTLLGVLGFQVLFFGILIGMRKYLVFMFFGILVLWVLRRGFASLPKFRMAAAAAVLLAFFSFWGTVRHRPLAELLEGGVTETMYADSGPAYEGYLQGVGGPFEVACLVYELFPEHEEFRNGSTLAVALLGYIPRAIWPDKPIGIGKEITRYIVGPFYEPVYGFSVTVTLPADLYLNFGWFGLVVGGLFAGVLCRTVAAYARHGAIGATQRVAARAILPAAFVMGLGEVRSDMSMILTTYALVFVPLIASFVFFRIDLEPGPEPRDGAPLPADTRRTR